MKALSYSCREYEKGCAETFFSRRRSVLLDVDMKKKHRSTIYDVANQAGVSITTVSRVLNAPGMVKTKTKELVLKVIRDLQFIPHAEASSRSRKDFRRIGVLLPYLTTPSFVQRMRGITTALPGNEYEVIIYAVDNAEQLEEYMHMLPHSGRVDGLIILSLPIKDIYADRLLEGKLETVMVETGHPYFSSVEINNAEGGRLVAQDLVKRGYKRFGFVGETGEPPYSLHPGEDRLRGYKEELKRLGFDLPGKWICMQPFSMEKVVDKACRLMEGEMPEVIFAASDMQAVAVLKAARRMGIRVPEDLGLIGFDSIDISDYMDITTVNQCLDESGRLAAELLRGRLEDDTRPVQNITLRLTIVERGTLRGYAA